MSHYFFTSQTIKPLRSPAGSGFAKSGILLVNVNAVRSVQRRTFFVQTYEKGHERFECEDGAEIHWIGVAEPTFILISHEGITAHFGT